MQQRKWNFLQTREKQRKSSTHHTPSTPPKALGKLALSHFRALSRSRISRSASLVHRSSAAATAAPSKRQTHTHTHTQYRGKKAAYCTLLKETRTSTMSMVSLERRLVPVAAAAAHAAAARLQRKSPLPNLTYMHFLLELFGLAQETPRASA